MAGSAKKRGEPAQSKYWRVAQKKDRDANWVYEDDAEWRSDPAHGNKGRDGRAPPRGMMPELPDGDDDAAAAAATDENGDGAYVSLRALVE